MSLPSPVLTYHSVASPLNVKLQSQPANAHVAIAVVPEVTVEFSTMDDGDDEAEQQERNVPIKEEDARPQQQQHQQQRPAGVVTEADDTHGTR